MGATESSYDTMEFDDSPEYIKTRKQRHLVLRQIEQSKMKLKAEVPSEPITIQKRDKTNKKVIFKRNKRVY